MPKISVGDKEPFVRLIQVAKDDPEVSDRLVAILSLDRFNRVSLLNTYIGEMRLMRAPGELVEALECLLSDEVAERALEILTGRARD